MNEMSRRAALGTLAVSLGGASFAKANDYVSRDDMEDVCKVLIKKAKAGDVEATKLLFDRIYGKQVVINSVQSSVLECITVTGSPLVLLVSEIESVGQVKRCIGNDCYESLCTQIRMNSGYHLVRMPFDECKRIWFEKLAQM